MSHWLGVVLVPVADADADAAQPTVAYDAAHALISAYTPDGEDPRSYTRPCGCALEKIRKDLDAELERTRGPWAELVKGAKELPEREKRDRLAAVKTRWNERMMLLRQRRHGAAARADCPDCAGSGRVQLDNFIEYWNPLEADGWSKFLERREKNANTFVLPFELSYSFTGAEPPTFPAGSFSSLGLHPRCRDVLALKLQDVVLAPFSLLEANGTWHERDDMADRQTWQKTVEALLSASPDHYVVPADFHG